MSKNTHPLKLPNSVRAAAAAQAELDGVSLNQFIAAAVAEKVGTLRAAREFLQERAGSAKPRNMLKFLRRAPKVAPIKGDERKLIVAQPMSLVNSVQSRHWTFGLIYLSPVIRSARPTDVPR